MLERSDGDAVIYGHKLSDGIDPIRRLIGFCPQHDVVRLPRYRFVLVLILLIADMNS